MKLFLLLLFPLSLFSQEYRKVTESLSSDLDMVFKDGEWVKESPIIDIGNSFYVGYYLKGAEIDLICEKDCPKEIYIHDYRGGEPKGLSIHPYLFVPGKELLPIKDDFVNEDIFQIIEMSEFKIIYKIKTKRDTWIISY